MTTPTLAWTGYSDPAVLRVEQDRIFGRAWQYVAHTGQVAKAGSFVAVRAGHLPVVIVRDRDEKLRAFINVCRHRGSIICVGEGERDTLQCPYHAWTYSLDGSLIGAPRAHQEADFDTEELGLQPVKLATLGPFIFVNPDANAPSLDEHLGELPALLAEGGVDLDRLVFRRRFEGEYEANWKICAENFLECYHCSVAHPSFSKAIAVAPDVYALESRQGLLSQFASPRNGGGGVYDATGEIPHAQFHLLFPNTTINVFPGQPNIAIGPIIPLNPERTYRSLDYFFAPDTDEAWIEEYMALDDQVGAEDRALVERVQAGVRATPIEHGVLLPRSEHLIASFQRLLTLAVADSSEDHS